MPIRRSMALPDVSGPWTRPTASMVRNPSFAYTTGLVGGAAIAANGTATASVSIQAAENFLCHEIRAWYDQDDWTFRVTLGGMAANLFSQDILGVLVFGPQPTATVSSFPYGWVLASPMLIPSNTTVQFNVTNGATGVLNIHFGLFGNRLTA